jgi:FkbM family methyltransferase
MGWRGINVDATPGSMRAFEAIRRRDINVEVAVSDGEREIEFYWWAKPGVVNTVSPENAQKWTRDLGREPRVARVRTTTLAALLGRYLPEGQSIDFMTVDVEGHDLAVLRSNDWDRYRPELVLVEHEVPDAASLLSLDVTALMEQAGYVLHSWLRPNLVFRDQRAAG